jgi:sugar lactone lactonase YvrE
MVDLYISFALGGRPMDWTSQTKLAGVDEISKASFNFKQPETDSVPIRGTSFYTTRLDDPQAVYLTPEHFPVKGDGIMDDTDALQQAINKIQEKIRYGIVFIPEGRYRLSKTVHVWKGIRLIGYGQNRPVFVLGKNTPGYQEGKGKYLIHFTNDRPDEGKPIRDASPGTFYSAIGNINFEIQDGNPAAIAVRSFFAQHCYLAHIDFYTGSGRAGVEKVGNEIDDCRFFGGDFGIITTKPSPSWPFLMIDSYFEGQRIAAIETEEGGLTLVRNHFKNIPGVIVVRPDRAEELWMTDSRMEDISGPAIIISDEYNARLQINLKDVVCERAPVLAAFRQSGRQIMGPSSIYQVKDFCHGLQIEDLGYIPEIKTTSDLIPLDEAPDPALSDIPALPPCDTWVNLASLGAKGDGITDDTEVIRAAIEQHRTIYFPTGRYRVTETITMKPDTVLIGISPITTQIIITDRTPAFDGEGPPKPLLVAPKGGTNIVTGIGLNTYGINRRAVAAKWMAGPNSMMNDVRFLGGHGTHNADGSAVPVYNNNRTGDGNPDYQWDSQYWSLWITDGGGGTFKDIWTPSPYAQAGIYISNTATEGRIYAMSVEHHVRNEAILRNVSNWKIYDLQMEEESGEGWNALPLHIENSSNIIITNLYLYRISRIENPFPYGVRIKSSHDLEFRGIHVYSPNKLSYDNTIYDQTQDVEIRSREIAGLKIAGKPPQKRPVKESPVLAPGARLEKVTGGFEFIDGATVDGDGNIYFTESRWHSIYRWSETNRDLTLVSDIPISPVGLAFDKSGNLLIVTRNGSVFALNPAGSIEEMRVLSPAPAAPREGMTAILPGHRWRDYHDFLKVATERSEVHYISPDGSVFIPKCEDLRRAFSLRAAIPGQPFYGADEFGQKTYAFKVNSDGSLINPRLFAEEGELDVAVDEAGNVYVAAGYIFVYDKTGKQIEIIDVPERPACLVFGGEDRKTLYITARSSLYKVKMRFRGR